MKKCLGYEGHECGKTIADWFKYCESCNFHFKVMAEQKLEELQKRREFMQDKQALALNIN